MGEERDEQGKEGNRGGMQHTHFVEWQSETSVDVHAMEHSQPKHTTHKVEIREMFLQ